jgi:hypothetical protein
MIIDVKNNAVAGFMGNCLIQAVLHTLYVGFRILLILDDY